MSLQKEILDEFSNGASVMGTEKDPLLSESLTDEGYVQARDVPSPARVGELNGTSSPWGAVFIVVNAALGAGLLTFPYAFFLAGGRKDWYWGLGIQTVGT